VKTSASLVHPFIVYVTVKVVVEKRTGVIVEVLLPPGNHWYVPPAAEGVAVNEAELPSQIIGVVTFKLKVGVVPIVTVADSGPAVHPDRE
jgi:hypothetical protein